MSHGGSGADKAEPNLTPMLDMVLQLVMFFMLVANFSMQEFNQDIMLPEATTAHASDKEVDSDVLTLNLTADGDIRLGGGEIRKPDEMAGWLADQFKFMNEARRIKKPDEDEKKRDFVVIIRAHRDSDWGPVHNVLRQAKAAGFKKWQLRVNQRN